MFELIQKSLIPSPQPKRFPEVSMGMNFFRAGFSPLFHLLLFSLRIWLSRFIPLGLWAEVLYKGEKVGLWESE
jgi:hypothetical protein